MESSHSSNTGTMKFINGDYHKAKLPPQTKSYWQDLLVSYNDPTSKYYDANFPADDRIEDVPSDEEFNNIKACLDGFPCLLFIRQGSNQAYENRGIFNFNLDKDAPNNLGFKGNPKMLAYEISANSDIGSGAFRSYSWTGAGSIPSEFEVRYHPYEDDVIDSNEMLIEGKHDALSRLVKWVVNCKEDNVIATIFDNIDIPAGTPSDQFQYYTDTGINKWLSNNHLTPVIGYPAGRKLKPNAVPNTDGTYDDDQYDPVPAKAGSRVNVMMGNRFIDKQGITQSLAGKQYVLEKSGPDDSDSNAHWVLPYKITSTGYNYYCAGESQQFKDEVSQYFDVQYLIDYYVFVYTTAMVDNFGKNLMLHTWDSKIWYPCFYDMDTMLGVDNSGQLIYGPSADMLTNDYNTSFSKLWTMVAGNFAEQIRNRYIECRQNGKFTITNFMKCYYDDVAAGQVGEIYFDQDAEVKYFPFKGQYNHMCNGNRQEWNRRWFRERLVYMDSVFNYVEKGNTNTAIIRANKTGPVKLAIKTYSPQYVTITFSGAQGNSERKLCYNDRWTEFNGTITTSKDNEVNITGAPNLMYIDGVKDIYPSVLNLDNATKLVEVDCRNSPHLRSLSLASNKLLQRVDVSGCNNLGETNTTLDLSEAVNLKSLNISGTKLIELKLPESGSALKELNCSNTKMTTFMLNGQAVLPSVNLSNCSDLATVSISNCNSLLNVDLSNSILSTFTANNNEKLEDIDVSNTPRLTNFSISMCPGLKRVKMRYLTNPTLTECKLQDCDMIEEVDITGSIYITNIRVGSSRQYKALKVLKASGSGLVGITKGTDVAADSLILTGYNMTGIDVSNCPNIVAIYGLNLTGPINNAFYNCTSLNAINGKLTVNGSANSAFKNCISLITLPTGSNFNVSGVVDAESMFEGCVSLTKETFLDLLPRFQSVQNIYKMWYGCSGIEVGDEDFSVTTFSQWREVRQWYWPFTGIKFTSPINMSTKVGMLDKCTKLETIRELFPVITGALPEGFFKNCTRLSNLWGAFAQTVINDVYYGLTAVPSGSLLSNCKLVTNVTDMFNNNVNMKGSIPANILSACTSLEAGTGMFRNCESLSGEIPATIFNNCTEVSRLDYFFSGCKKLTGSIPAALLANNTKLQNIKGLFAGCIGLTGSIPATLLANNKQLSTVAELFNGCNGLGGVSGQTQEIPATLFSGLVQLLDASNAFRDCSKLLFTLDTQIFKDCTALVNISGVFAGCQGLTGSIQPSFFSCVRNGVSIPMSIQNASEVFSGCQGLSGTIPSNMFDNFTAVEDLSSFFYKCTNLTGEIPDNLLYNCPNLTKAANMFTQCSGLGKIVVDDDTPFISPDFFSQNTVLQDVTGVFSQCSKFRGIIPDTLFTHNTRLKSVNSLLYGSINVRGNLTDNLFRNNQLLEDVGSAFRNCNNITSIDSRLFEASRHTKLNNFEFTFQGCINMTGTVPALWDMYPQANGNKCFADLNPTKITNYASIPGSWM